jgi:hypothetical protein
MNDHKLNVRVLVNTILSPLVGYTQLPINFLLLLFRGFGYHTARVTRAFRD